MGPCAQSSGAFTHRSRKETESWTPGGDPLLEMEGFVADTAKNGFAALEYLDGRDSVPSLILLDLMMPEMDGWEFRRRQIEHPKYRVIPTVVVSAAGASSKLIDVEVIKKPVDLDLLLATVRRFCR